ncbi:MAG: hypothetical protein QM626_08590 [Microbacterium sp.]|uniref:hypothetical protein n=1 Tax=Microbacterium sp. TaxID=51671 RepID=UPI0039E22D6E
MPDNSGDVDGMTAEEAERIVRNAGAGRLDMSDPEIRKLVATAQRSIARHTLWGDVSGTRHRRWVIGGILFLLLWLIGLAVPFLSTFVWSR